MEGLVDFIAARYQLFQAVGSQTRSLALGGEGDVITNGMMIWRKGLLCNITIFTIFTFATAIVLFVLLTAVVRNKGEWIPLPVFGDPMVPIGSNILQRHPSRITELGLQEEPGVNQGLWVCPDFTPGNYSSSAWLLWMAEISKESSDKKEYTLQACLMTALNARAMFVLLAFAALTSLHDLRDNTPSSSESRSVIQILGPSSLSSSSFSPSLALTLPTPGTSITGEWIERTKTNQHYPFCYPFSPFSDEFFNLLGMSLGEAVPPLIFSAEAMWGSASVS